MTNFTLGIFYVKGTESQAPSCAYGKSTYIELMDVDYSIDEKIFSDRKSSYLVKVTGKKKREGLLPGDVLVVDRSLPHEKDKLGVVVRNGKFTVERVGADLIQNDDPEKGDFIWGMIRALVREV